MSSPIFCPLLTTFGYYVSLKWMTAFSFETLLSIQQVAKILNLSEKTIRRRIKDLDNPMPFVNYGTPKRPLWRVDPTVLKNWSQMLEDPRRDV